MMNGEFSSPKAYTGIETEYLRSKFQYQKCLMNYFLAVYSLILLSYFIYTQIESNSPALFAYGFYALAFAIVLVNYAIINKKRVLLNNYLMVFAVVSIIIQMESLREISASWNKSMIFSSGGLLQFLMMSPMIVRLRWTHAFLQGFLLGLYYCLRCMNWGENKEMNYYPLLTLIMNNLMTCLGTYLMEKHERNIFFSVKQNERSLKRYKHLLKEVIPSCIIIAEGDNIIFSNKECQRIFQTREKEEIQQKLKEIYMNEKNPSFSEFRSNNMLFNSVGRIESSSQFDTLIEKILNNETQVTEKKSLHDFLLADTIKGSLDFKNFIGYYNKQDFESTTENFLDIQMSKIMWEGKEATLVMINEDYLLEKLRHLNEQNRYKDKLLATVSHDLRTPLNGIIGVIEFVSETIADPMAKKSLLIALRSSQLLSYMINDILDMTQITNGSLRLKLIPFSLIDCFNDVFKLIKFQAKKKGLECSFDYANLSVEDKEKAFINDPSRLKQVILNLLGNALKFTQKGKISISLESQRSEGAHRSVLVKVSDTGCGIKKEDLPRIFRLFGKLETEESKRINQTGVGLGLVISQSLIRLMNQGNKGLEEIKVESELGKGSTFYFILYSQEELQVKPSKNEIKGDSDLMFEGVNDGKEFSEEISAPEQSSSVQIVPPSIALKNQKTEIHITKKNVLVVDDDQINIMVICKYLDSFDDCVYKVASNGLQALEMVKLSAETEEYYDIIFMDCNMPIMDGYQASQEILKLAEKNIVKPVPIIAATANVSEADYENCFRAGMAGHISKPFTRRTIRMKLDEFCDKKW